MASRPIRSVSSSVNKALNYCPDLACQSAYSIVIELMTC